MNTKLSPLQKKVVKCLQDDFVLITDNQIKGAMVGNSKGEFHISNRVFCNLIDKGLIYQQLQYPFNYILSIAGQNYK